MHPQADDILAWVAYTIGVMIPIVNRLSFTQIKRRLSSRCRLQWKLTLSYALVATAAILLVEVIALALFSYFTFRSPVLPRSIARQLAQSSTQAAWREVIVPSALAAILATLVIGILFGLATASRLTRRVQRLIEAANAWGQGNFNVLAGDASADELGQLARHFNHMAIELQHLLETRQELAALEARNRLACDLHDSVKQQVFAIAMQVGAAQAMLPHNPAAAQTHLAESRRLAQQAQQELTDLIHELRPATMIGKGGTAALREYVAEWSRQSHIAAEVRTQGECPLPLAAEQAIFGVVQSSLANIARHSQANKVKVQLAWQEDEVILTISDNEQSFNVEKVWKRQNSAIM